MLKKIRDKITEEVQQTSLRLPVSVQQSVQQLTQKSATDQWLEAVKEGSQLNLSPFSGAATSPGEQKKELETGSLQDELLVDISDIRPAGHNKDLFSIDEDSHEGSPSKSGFQLVDLSDAETVTLADSGGAPGQGQGVAGVTFDPTIGVTSSPAHRARRDSSGSSVSDASGLFPIYEVPGVSFNMPQSDLESSSEWEDGSSGAVMDRLSKDTVYQAYLKMRQRYHKYKGRYADLARAYKDKEKESEKLRDVLTKTQDKALRKVSELKEQCTLEQQAKAHLEQELRSDLEEKDHKIAALQTKVKILQEGVTGDLNNTVVPSQNNDQSAITPQDVCFVKSQVEADSVSAGDSSSGTDNVSTTESVSMADNISMADNVSVASHGSASTAVIINTEAEELIEKLKGDVAKHKSLLARCMDNIRGNKERITLLTQERDIATTQLQDKLKQIDVLKEEHVKELESLKYSMESSALSMAETKKQLFEELQVKEAETERCKQAAAAIEKQLEEERDRWQEELQLRQQELEEKETTLLELGTNTVMQEDQAEGCEESVAAIKKEVEAKIHQLETRTLEFKESRTELETQLTEINQAKAQLEEKVQQLMKDKEELNKKMELLECDKVEMEQNLVTLENVKVELEGKMTGLKSVNNSLEEQVKELSECKIRKEEKLEMMMKSQKELQKQIEELREAHIYSTDSSVAASQEILALKEANEKLTCSLGVSQKENRELKASLDHLDMEKEDIQKDVSEKRTLTMELQAQVADLEEKLKTCINENSDLNEEIKCIAEEKELIDKELIETRTDMNKERNVLTEETVYLKLENEKTVNELKQVKSEKEHISDKYVSLQQNVEILKSEKEKLSLELSESKENMTKVNQEAFAELSLVTEKMDKLNSDWAQQMNEKDIINKELSQKVTELNQYLKLKTDENNHKIESLNSLLKQKEENETEFQMKIKCLSKDNKIFCKDISDMKEDLQAKEIEIQNMEKKMIVGSTELNARVIDLESHLKQRNEELTAVVQEKNRFCALLENIRMDKTKLQDELETAHGEIINLKEVIPALKTALKKKEEENSNLMEEMTVQSEKNKITREEMQRVSESLETEMTKAKDSYTKLKDNYDKFIKEKETILAGQNKKISELESKDLENRQCLCELQSLVKQREDKIEHLLNEKKCMLDELEKKVEEQQNELREKESDMKKRTADFELKVEELEAQMLNNDESLKRKLENSLEEKHDLEKMVAKLSHTALEKDEMIVRQAEDAEQKIADAQKDFTRKTKELEHTWEERLRCELDRLQKQHEENLASASMELNKSQQSQLEAARSNHQRAIATRDATIAALKDDLDQQQLSLQEELDTWRSKYENLQRELAEARCQSECQSERLRVIETTMEETSAQLATATAGCAGLEERLQQAKATCETLTAQVVALTNNNDQLKEKIDLFEKEKEETTKTIAMLEFNNEHNKNKVLNMELSNKDLQQKIEALWKEKGELMKQLREGSSGIYEQLTKEKEELEQKSVREKDELQEKHKREEKGLQEQLEGLMEIRLGYEKQISQIEANNADMHGKIGSVQLERDAARAEVAQLKTQKLDMEKKVDNLTIVKENLEEQVLALKGTTSILEERLEGEKNQVQTLSETINTLQNNILNLQKQVEGLKETSGKLARDLQSESKLRLETQAQLSQVKQMHRQLEESHSTDRITIGKLEDEKKDLEKKVSSLKETEMKVSKLQACIEELESDKKTLYEKLSIIPETVHSPTDNKVNIVVEQLTEKTQTNMNVRRNTDEDEIVRLKALLKVKDEEITRSQQTLKDVQERLRLAEVISGEVEEQREKMRELEAKMALADEHHRQQVKTVSLEAEKLVAAKEQECQQTISSAYDQQDNETSVLVQQHRDILREAQEQAREKSAALDSVVQDYQIKLKYEEQLASLSVNHETHIKEVEATWKSRAERMVRQRECQLQEEKDALTQEWNKERRELERLTQVAAAAFRSGTESVELLKKQVAAQRRELEEVKVNHGKEIGELKALLELKRRTRGSSAGGGGSGARLGVSLEEAAEFEYLKNILYQYMLGKETQTLSKVLCAVVKFDSHQQQEILEHEEQRQSLQLETGPGTVHPTLLEESVDLSKTL